MAMVGYDILNTDIRWFCRSKPYLREKMGRYVLNCTTASDYCVNALES